ncbi:MAG: hypothetical protein KAQ85_08190, partial [Thermodesulfovibrionia bacterium]|nr:hypothetical protein [Thermodesulfovibrionia bacterium]
VRFVRFSDQGDVSANLTWKQWALLNNDTIGDVDPLYPNEDTYASRAIYRKGEAHTGFVRTSNWGENTPGGTARYTYVGTAATPRTGGSYPNSIVQRNATGDIFAAIGYLEATQAQYADLAEKYTCDENLPVGTVVEVSSDTDFEVVPCMFENSPTVVGVVSRNPAYLMNSESVGLPIALTGKVDVRVTGAVNKGDFIVPAGDGLARKGEVGELVFKIGVVLKTDLQDEEKLVECIIK